MIQDFPDWFNQEAKNVWEKKYKTCSTLREQHVLIASALAKYSPYSFEKTFNNFFNILWKGWLSPASPVYSVGSDSRIMGVSCAGSYPHNSIDGFYKTYHEIAMLTKYGFGTSIYLGNNSPRGIISDSGVMTDGALNVMLSAHDTTQRVAQTGKRAGAIASYIDVEHKDFYEILTNAKEERAINVGFNISDETINAMFLGSREHKDIFNELCHFRFSHGRGYLHKIDTVNRQNPRAYVNNGLKVSASNLCNEIELFSDTYHTFSCVLSSLNLAKYDDWKDTDTVFWSIIFLDCLVSYFLEKAEGKPGLDNIIRFTNKSRALGLGVMGWHTYLQDHMIPVESIEAHLLNGKWFKDIKYQAIEASKSLARLLGEPEWCKDTGMRNSHLLAIAPTLTTSQLMGGGSEGINPYFGAFYSQKYSTGLEHKQNPSFVRLCGYKGINIETIRESIESKDGSIQHLNMFTDEEKLVFKNCAEIDQSVLIRQASVRQKYICQSQSLDLHYSEDTPKILIAKHHKQLLLDKYIKGAYYLRTMKNIKYKEQTVCEACQ